MSLTEVPLPSHRDQAAEIGITEEYLQEAHLEMLESQTTSVQMPPRFWETPSQPGNAVFFYFLQRFTSLFFKAFTG